MFDRKESLRRFQLTNIRLTTALSIWGAAFDGLWDLEQVYEWGLRYSLIKFDGESGPPYHSSWQHHSAIVAIKLCGWSCENPFVGSLLLLQIALGRLKRNGQILRLNISSSSF